MSRPAIKRLAALIALGAFSALAAALISQHVFGLMPCAWCVLQRLILILIGLTALAIIFLPFVLQKLLSAVVCVLGVCGMTAAWYQYSVASQLFSCDRTFADVFINDTLGLDQMAPGLFGIYASCMDAKASFLGLDYALWGLILFAVFTLMALWMLCIRKQPTAS